MDKNESLVSVLTSGGIAIIPTDTIYGVVGQALKKETVERIYQVKGRKPEKPFIILIAEIADIDKFEIQLNDFQSSVLAENWPGPVSIILPCYDNGFAYLHRGTESLAFRLPGNKELQNLIRKTGPLVAPSANPEGLEPADTIAKAKEYFKDMIDYYYDGGVVQGNPSRIIKVSEGGVEIIRK